MANARVLGISGKQRRPAGSTGPAACAAAAGSGQLTTVTFSFCSTRRARSVALSPLQTGLSVSLSAGVLARPLSPAASAAPRAQEAKQGGQRSSRTGDRDVPVSFSPQQPSEVPAPLSQGFARSQLTALYKSRHCMRKPCQV